MTQTMTVDEYKAKLAVDMTEKRLQKDVRKLAQDNGWHVFCWWSSLHSPKGWPDLVLMRVMTGIWTGWAQMTFIELKSERGIVSPDQEIALGMLKMTGHAVHVFRPSDLLNGRIAEALQ